MTAVYCGTHSCPTALSAGLPVGQVRNPWGKGELTTGMWIDGGQGWDKYPEVMHDAHTTPIADTKMTLHYIVIANTPVQSFDKLVDKLVDMTGLPDCRLQTNSSAAERTRKRITTKTMVSF